MPATTHIGARIDTELVERFGLLAARAGRSFSRELEAAMRDHLANAEQREKFGSMTDAELEALLAGVDDGRPSA
ncbi:MAG: ribbon-helix-helix domain-containing protein [Actinomycetota bacterium]|nr:ribbon-helix-helix domain-containing protein [Actinomycetota bacterium]